VLSADHKIALLRQVPLFAGCSRRDLVRIARIADQVDFAPGKVLIDEGAVGREFFAIVYGSAEVRRKGRKIDTLGSGDFFGEMALLTDQPRNATVSATSAVEALVITKWKFRQMVASNPLIALKVAQTVAERTSWPGR
jgi:CRP/FNR family transcriptional regulator, cyclic AMP receptor protein